MQQLHTLHSAAVSRHMKAFGSQFCYIEVIAASPAAQGRGIGRKLMDAVVAEVPGVPCILECTDKKTIPFYAKFGFKLVEEVVLKDQQESQSVWVMVREPPPNLLANAMNEDPLEK